MRLCEAIILYSAHLDEQIEREAREAGVAQCVAKSEGLSTPEREVRRLGGEAA